MKSAIISLPFSVEVSKMPNLLCTGCKSSMGIEIPRPGDPLQCNPGRLLGSAICRKCGVGTGFEIENNTIIYVSGKSSYGSLDTTLSETAKTF